MYIGKWALMEENTETEVNFVGLWSLPNVLNRPQAAGLAKQLHPGDSQFPRPYGHTAISLRQVAR